MLYQSPLHHKPRFQLFEAPRLPWRMLGRAESPRRWQSPLKIMLRCNQREPEYESKTASPARWLGTACRADLEAVSVVEVK